MPSKKTFKSMLAGLTAERNKIGHLTAQARADLQYDASLAEVDVNAITSYVVSRNADDRLAGLYLIDSICQNIGGRYVPLFEEHIMPLIETTYRYGSSQTRKSLCKILNVWKSRKIFPISILRNIFNSIKNPTANAQIRRQMPSHPPAQSHIYSQPAPPSYYASHPQSSYPPPPYHPNHRSHPPPSYHNSQYPPPHQPSSHYGAYPPQHYQQHPPPYGQQPTQPQSGWRGMCSKYNISPIHYEQSIQSLISSISMFIKSPYSYRNGIFVETPQLKNSEWQCPQQIVDEFEKAINEFNNYHIDITRKLYFICTELKHQGVNASSWQQKLNSISPWNNMNDANNANSESQKISICEFYNSTDGCRSGSNCKYLHVTDKEAEIRKKLLKRVHGRYQFKDIKFIDDYSSDVKIATFYTYFGEQNDLKKKHARSIKLLYGKKLKICPNCSLRLTSEAFPKHMKWHFHRRNCILIKKRQSGFKSQQYGMFRNWYPELETWLNSTESNKTDGDATMNKMNPFENISKNNEQNEPIKSNNALLSSLEQNKQNYEESQVLLNGISQVVICAICQEEFAKTNKEYNAQKDDWILKNACYSDGTTSKDERNKDNARNLKIVHRKCYDLKQQQQQNDLEDDDRLKPKLYDKNQTISKIEEQFNENGTSSVLNQIAKKQKKRKFNDLFGVSDDDDDDEEDEEEHSNGVSNGNGEKMLKITKKRRLNNGNVEEKKSGNEKEEMDHVDDDDDDDDLQGIGLDDIANIQEQEPQNADNPVTFSVNGDSNKDKSKEHIAKEESAETEAAMQGQNEEEEDDANADNVNMDDLDNVDLDDIELDDIELDEDDLDDDDDEDAEDIVLFDPDAYNESFQGSYSYRRR